MSPGDIVGRTLAGKYQVRRLLGEGGMGFVVEAEDLGLERSVAIKFLQPEYTCHGEARERFLREARAAAKIHSEHVARVIDVNVTQQGTPYMVMEYLEGVDLCQLLKQEDHLSIEAACLYLIQACEPLAEAHTQGIVHRDLKPANLFLECHAGGAARVKLLDFGISKTLGPDNVDKALTRTSASMGSPLYMSPEQMRSSRDVDCRTDVWALGVILFEALSGQVPFEGGSVPEVAAQILLEQPRDLLQAAPWVPVQLADCVMRTLAKEPDDRVANVGELAKAIAPFAPGEAQTTLERIERILSAGSVLAAARAAGANEAGVDPFFPGSTAPTKLDSGPGDPETNFGKTRGLSPTAKRRSGGVVFALALGASLSVVLAIVLTTQAPLRPHPHDGLAASLERNTELASAAAAVAPSGSGLPPKPTSNAGAPASAGLPDFFVVAASQPLATAVPPVAAGSPLAAEPAPRVPASLAQPDTAPAKVPRAAAADAAEAKDDATPARASNARASARKKAAARTKARRRTKRTRARRGSSRPTAVRKDGVLPKAKRGAARPDSSAPEAPPAAAGSFTSRFGTRK